MRPAQRMLIMANNYTDTVAFVVSDFSGQVSYLSVSVADTISNTMMR